MKARAILALFAGVIAACSSRPIDDGAKRFTVVGVVEKVVDDQTLEIKHNEIEGFMPAMTMPFRLKGRKSSDFSTGDFVRGTLAVGDKESWLEDARIMGRAAVNMPKPAHAVGQEGDLLPDFPLTNQSGAGISTSSYKGKVLLITFIYTRCPLPEFCPRMMTQFREIDKTVAADPALAGRVHLLAVSFDPKFDTPDVLQAFGSAFAEDRGHGRFADWEFATGSPDDIRRIADFFGVQYFPDDETFGHNLRTAVIAADGKVARILADNSWEAKEALDVVRTLAPAASSARAPEKRR